MKEALGGATLSRAEKAALISEQFDLEMSKPFITKITREADGILNSQLTHTDYEKSLHQKNRRNVIALDKALNSWYDSLAHKQADYITFS